MVEGGSFCSQRPTRAARTSNSLKNIWPLFCLNAGPDSWVPQSPLLSATYLKMLNYLEYSTLSGWSLYKWDPLFKGTWQEKSTWHSFLETSLLPFRMCILRFQAFLFLFLLELLLTLGANGDICYVRVAEKEMNVQWSVLSVGLLSFSAGLRVQVRQKSQTGRRWHQSTHSPHPQLFFHDELDLSICFLPL